MREQGSANSFRPVAQSEAAIKWSTQQSIMEWMLEKSGAGMVRVEYQDMDWWYQFMSREKATSSPKKLG